MVFPPPARIIWMHKRWQPPYAQLQSTVPGVEFVEEIHQEAFCNSRFPTLIIIDDLMKSATADDDVCDLFTESAHHRNLSVMCLFHTIFYKARGTQTMHPNCQYPVVFKNQRYVDQISILF